MNSKTGTGNPKLILAGDLGGTKTLLALAAGGVSAPSSGRSPQFAAEGAPEILFERRYASRDWNEFRAILRAFLDEAGAAGTIERACLAVAGPVEDKRSKITYLPWLIDADALAAEFGIGDMELVNDFAAAARGIEALGAADLVTLQEGLPRADAPRLVVGAGTGLGVAGLVPEAGGWRVIAGEGGHIGFAPLDEVQIDLWRHLHARPGRVTAERVLSGPGLVEIYRLLCTRDGAPDKPDPLHAADPAAAVGALALSDPGSLSSRALDIFVRAYGSFAGDLALLFMARGGVYLAGGVASKILPRLRQGGFLEAFRARAEHAALMPGFPVRVVINEKLGLLGAATMARTDRS